jgi:uncharacterized protein with NAD-binding domain and iron-sulfur cluster
VILGGGMAGLTAAWALSGPDERADIDVCVYERAEHLGGKGASTRGVHGRIEEHGLHVWLGYYDNAFRLMREVYDELDRDATDPGCPITTWRDAFGPADLVGVEDRRDDGWSHWVTAFGRNSLEPGVTGDATGPLGVAAFVRRGLGLLIDFSGSLGQGPRDVGAGNVVLSGSPEPPAAAGPDALAQFAELMRRAEIAAMVGAVESIRMLRASVPEGGPLAAIVVGSLERMRADIAARVRRDIDARRAAELADLVIAAIQGTIRDGLLTDPAGFAAVDHLDFRVWLSRHGARPETLASPLIRGMYDLVFAYEEGDPERPAFPAGLGLFLAGKLFFEYKGSIFWHLRAGMGDVVFAPLYQALRARGVRFRFCHRVERLRLSRDAGRVEAIVMSRDRAAAERDLLIRVGGLPCFPSRPRMRAVDGGERFELTAGADFDHVVLAMSLGAVPSVCAELLEAFPRWGELTTGVPTVPTQSLQLWMGADERELGWPYPGATVSGYVTPFDTYASMSHLIPREEWPAEQMPKSIAYFCSVLRPDASAQAVRDNAQAFLERDIGQLWPGAVDADGGFRWDLLCGGLDGQHWRANVEPSDRYVQSPPGTGRLRLRADASGCDNLALAGDWIDCGLNAGCIEAAVLGGIQAANAVRRLPAQEGVLGSWNALGAA